MLSRMLASAGQSIDHKDFLSLEAALPKGVPMPDAAELARADRWHRSVVQVGVAEERYVLRLEGDTIYRLFDPDGPLPTDPLLAARLHANADDSSIGERIAALVTKGGYLEMTGFNLLHAAEQVAAKPSFGFVKYTAGAAAAAGAAGPSAFSYSNDDIDGALRLIVLAIGRQARTVTTGHAKTRRWRGQHWEEGFAEALFSCVKQTARAVRDAYVGPELHSSINIYASTICICLWYGCVYGRMPIGYSVHLQVHINGILAGLVVGGFPRARSALMDHWKSVIQCGPTPAAVAAVTAGAAGGAGAGASHGHAASGGVSAAPVLMQPRQHAYGSAGRTPVKAAGKQCAYCDKKGHAEEGCWKKHPELHPSAVAAASPARGGAGAAGSSQRDSSASRKGYRGGNGHGAGGSAAPTVPPPAAAGQQ